MQNRFIQEGPAGRQPSGRPGSSSQLAAARANRSQPATQKMEEEEKGEGSGEADGAYPAEVLSDCSRRLHWGGACGARLCDRVCFGRTVRALASRAVKPDERGDNGDTDGGTVPNAADDGGEGSEARRRSPRRGSAAVLYIPDTHAGQKPSSLAPPATSAAAAAATPRQNRTWGVVCALGSVLAWAPDGVFVPLLKKESNQRSVQQSDAVVILWKWLVVSLICGSAVLLQLWREYQQKIEECARTGSIPPRRLLSMGCSGWVHMAVGALGCVVASLHTIGLMHATPSIAIMFYYLNPLWSVLLDAAVLRTAVPRRTLLALPCALAAALLALLGGSGGVDAGGCTVDGGGGGGDGDNCASAAHSDGDMAFGLSLSAAAGLGYACFLAACSSAAVSCPHVPMNLAPLAGNLATALVLGLAVALAQGATVAPRSSAFWCDVMSVVAPGHHARHQTSYRACLSGRVLAN
jgi:drug/metabolite transporter (DMT)-like permease